MLAGGTWLALTNDVPPSEGEYSDPFAGLPGYLVLVFVVMTTGAIVGVLVSLRFGRDKSDDGPGLVEQEDITLVAGEPQEFHVEAGFETHIRVDVESVNSPNQNP